MLISPDSRRPRALLRDVHRLLQLNREHRRRLGIGIILTLLAAALSLAVPLGIRALIDTAIAGTTPGVRSRAPLDHLALALLALLLVQAGVNLLGTYLLSWTGERIVDDFRVQIYAHLHRMSHRFFWSAKIGDLTSRLTSDVTAVRTAATGALAELLTVCLQLVGSAVLLIAISWHLGLMILLAIPASALVGRCFGLRVRRLSCSVQERLAEATAMAQEMLSAIQVVLAFARRSYEVDRYRRAVECLFAAQRQRALVVAFFGAAIATLFFFLTAAIFWYGGLDVLRGRLTVGDLVASTFYALSMSQAVGSLSSLHAAYSRAAGASERLFDILDTRSDVEEAPSAIKLSVVEGRVCFDHVSFSYHVGHPVLREVSFEASPGETIALVGPSGGGKSTLTNLIPRFFDPQLGRVLIDGRDIRDLQLESLRQCIAIVPQDTHLLNLTIMENIRYGRLDASHDEVIAAAQAADAHEFISHLQAGYQTVVGERGVRLSGGQKQRVAIARALLRNAAILLFDEATSSLDSASESRVRSAIGRLTRGRTCFIVAHRLSTIRNADRILVIDRGCIAEQGSHSELVARRGLYSELAARQFDASDGEESVADDGIYSSTRDDRTLAYGKSA